MNFALDAGGSQALGQGLGNLFKTAAMGQMYGQQAEMNAALKSAQMQHHQASANKALTEAEQGRAALAIQNDPIENAMLSLGLPRALAPAFRNKIDTGSWGGGYDTPAYDGVGPTMPAPASDDTVKRLGQAMSITQRMLATGSKVHQGTDAALDEQRMRGIDAVMADPTLAPAVGKAYAATAGKPLFNDVGNTGYSMDNFTGAEAEANAVLAKLFSNKENSTSGLNNARRDRVTSGLDKPVTVVDDETGKATITAIPTTGDPRTIGVAPAKGNGVDATNAKSKNAIIAAVEKEMPYADEAKISAEVEKRLTRRGISSEARTHDGYPARKNADGSYSTEVSITVTNPKLNGGKPTNIPSMWGGKELSEEQSVEKALASGKKYESFSTIDAAVSAAKNRSHAGGAGAPAAQPKLPDIPPGYKQVGTSNGKPVYLAPNGKKYIAE